MKLFVFYIGGSVPGAHLELHDMRFAIGDTAEACWPALKSCWWGTPESLHLDAWGALEFVDGYRLELHQTPQNRPEKLWFVHLGGYDQAQFTELHQNTFLVAETARDAKREALKAVSSWFSPHKDASMDVDAVIDVAKVTQGEPWYVHLVRSNTPQPFKFETRYVPIGKMGHR